MSAKTAIHMVALPKTASTVGQSIDGIRSSSPPAASTTGRPAVDSHAGAQHASSWP
jgi:hypothetical protein